MFGVLKSKAYKDGVYLGAPEAEGETSAASRVSIVDVYDDYHDLIPQLSTEKFIVIGRKGCGKSAFAQYVAAKSTFEPNLFCSFVKNGQSKLEDVVQLGESCGTRIDKESLFTWIIYTNILKLFSEVPSISENGEFEPLRKFLAKNSGFIDIGSYEIKELVSKFGFEVATEHFKRLVSTVLRKNFETKSERAAFYKLIPDLEACIIKLLSSHEVQSQENKFAIFFDDLDIDFSVSNEKSVESVVALVRACRHINLEVFGKNDINAKAIILLRDDIEAYLTTRFADTAKIFSSYSAEIHWYQQETASHAKSSNSNLRKFLNRRIIYALKKANMSVNESDPWSSLVKYDNGNSDNAWSYVLSQTMFRPRDLLLFFKPLESGAYSIPLKESDITSLAQIYADELASEIKNELSSFFSSDEVINIFSALREITRTPSCSYESARTIIDEYVGQTHVKDALASLFDRSIIGNENPKSHWKTFKYRDFVNTPTPATLDPNQVIIVQHAIRNHVVRRVH